MTKIAVDLDELYTVEEFAIAVKRGVATIWRWIAAKKVVAVKLGDRTLIPTSELQRLSKELGFDGSK